MTANNQSTTQRAETAEKVNTLATDVAVMRVQLDHVKETSDKVLTKLEALDVVTSVDFEIYKTHVKDTFVPRHELEGLIKWYNFASSTIGKILICALIGLSGMAGYGAFKDLVKPPGEVRQLIPVIPQQLKEEEQHVEAS